MSWVRVPSSPTRRGDGDTVPSCHGEIFIDNYAKLKACDDPATRQAFQQLRDTWLAAAKHHLSMRPKSPPPEELEKRREERRRKGLLIALNTYAKRNNMQLDEFELVEEKHKNLVDGCIGEYVHFNFVVKGVDGTPTMFFAEIHCDCSGEDEVVLCTPLKDNNDSGHCFGCNRRAKKLRHPIGGGYLGGQKEVSFYLVEEDSDDEYFI